jgi:hypothetical protein
VSDLGGCGGADITAVVAFLEGVVGLILRAVLSVPDGVTARLRSPEGAR